jgi:hypothetical protein
LFSISGESRPTADVHSSVKDILLEYQDIFAEPTGLPSTRFYDHSIPLIPGYKPMTTRPCRHCYDQKNEVEMLFKEMI